MQYALPDGKQLTLPEQATGADAAAAIGPGLARAALAVKVGDELRDLARPLPDGAGPAKGLEILTERSGEEALALIRHDAAHVLAAAVLDLYPGVKISIGPAIDDGFYYDFEFPDGVTVSDADFEQIEARMQEHIDADEPFVREDVPVADALARFRSEQQDYKVELIEDLIRDEGVDTVSLVHQRQLHRPVPRPARPDHEADQGVQAAVGRRRVLARGLQPHPAHARVRDGVLLAQGPRGVPRAPRARARQRPPPPRPAAGAVHVLRRLAGGRVLAAGRDPGLQLAGRAEPRDGGAARLHGGQDAAAVR